MSAEESKSNINSYYEDLVNSIAERAYDNIKDGGYSDDSECIWQAIDDGLMFYCDQGYILAFAVCNGYINWGKPFEWDAVYEMLYSNVVDELEYLKNKE